MSQSDSKIIGRALSGLLAVLAAAASAAEPVWTMQDGRTVAAGNVFFQDGIVTLAVTNPPRKVTMPFADLSAAEKQQLLLLENAPYPPHAPAWLSGYRVRYPLRIAGDLLTATSRTVIARLPTGGWLKTNAADIVVQTVTGRRLPTAVLAHDPIGNTIVQFERNGYDRWYWAYALNANPPPAGDPLLNQRSAEDAARAAQLAKMNAQKAAADAAEKLDRLNAEIARAQTTVNDAGSEIAQWDKLLPERGAAVRAIEEKIGAARDVAAQAASAAAAAKARADEQAAALKKSNDEVDAARKTAGKTALTVKGSALKAAEEAALPARLAAAKAAAAAADADKQLADLAAALKTAAAALAQGQEARAAAEQLKNKSARTIAELTAQIQPATEAVKAAKVFAGQALETARLATEAHRKIVADTDPTVWQEGLTVEFRQWAGDELADWAAVAAGLARSDNILFDAIVPEVIQNANPARRGDPRNFAASYRGFLRIAKPGVYRFFVNGDDAAYLFIDGFKVYSRRGTNRPLTGRAPVFSVGEDVEMEAGVHPFEIHHVVGNTPGAQGLCSFLWLPPGAKNWAFVPRAAFPEALLAAPVSIEESGGAQIAGFQCGMDDTLSAGGVTLYLVCFEAQGQVTRPQQLTWDFGDGTRATGRSVKHVYFREGDYEVGLKSLDSLPAFRRRVHVWSAPVPTSPFALAEAVDLLAGLDLARLSPADLNAMFAYLLICEQPARWPLLEKLCRNLLSRKGLDIEYRIQIYTALMEAMARQGRAAESMALTAQALAEVPRLTGMQLAVQRQAADIQWKYGKDFKAAGRMYEEIVAGRRSLRYPSVRQAAIAWGDMSLAAGDQARAGEAYRLAATLGGAGAAGEKSGDATTRGALLRVAEQQLKGGHTFQSRRLLERIENEFPEQKLEGLYRFLRAEADRTSGRYEDAARNYEFLLQLRQWSGYRAQALHGIADCCYRNGDYAEALEWLKGLSESFPDYYAQKGLTNYQAMIVGMLKRRQELGGPQGMAKAMFPGWRWSAASGGTEQCSLTGLRALPSLGMRGGTTAFVAALPAPAKRCAIEVKLTNVVSEGVFWVEFWYRDTLGVARDYPSAVIEFFGDNNRSGSRETLALEPTFGEWRKLAARLKAPVTKDGSVRLTFDNLLGLYEFDGLQIRPIADRQDEALRTYIEGANPP